MTIWGLHDLWFDCALARDLLRSPDRWLQRDYVTTADGKQLKCVCDPAASCWCIVAALDFVYVRGTRAFTAAIDKLADLLGFTGDTHEKQQAIARWNDHEERTFEDIQTVLRDL